MQTGRALAFMKETFLGTKWAGDGGLGAGKMVPESYIRESLLAARGYSNFDPRHVTGWDWSASIFMGSVPLIGNLALGRERDADSTEAKKVPPLKVSSFARIVVDNGSLWGYPHYSQLAKSLTNPTTTSHYYTLLAQRINSAPMSYKDYYGKALGVVCMDGKASTRKSIDDFYNNFQALKNIFHAFISLYNRIIESNVRQVSVMSPSQIYYSILSYLKQSALARRDLNPACSNLLSTEEYMNTGNEKGSDPLTTFSPTPWASTTDKYPYGTILGATTLATRLVGMILPAYYPTGDELTNYSSSYYNTDGDANWLKVQGDWGMGGAGKRPPITFEGWDNFAAAEGAADSAQYLHKQSTDNAADTYNAREGPKDNLSIMGLLYNRSLYNTGFIDLKGFRKGRIGHPIDCSKDFLASQYKSVYECEDRYCAMGIKSVASAVLSCIGLFTVTQQPVNMGLQRSVRSILGGGSTDEQIVEGGLGLLTSSLYNNFDSSVTPSISSGAFDSYYYITRLAEFYKILFDNLQAKQAFCVGDTAKKAADTPGNIGYSLQQGLDATESGADYVMRLPIDMEGEFGKVLFIVNNKNRGEQKDYTDLQCKVMINEINHAYQKYKDTNETVLGFVKEVNRRFSILSDKEANKTLKVFEERLEKGGIEGAMELSKYGQESTGSMPFSDESHGDADGINLDNIVTPSDALASSFSKYTTTDYDVLEGDDDYNYTPDRSVTSANPMRKRALEKYRLGCDFKLYQKLAMFRTELDRFFDDYLKTNEDNIRVPTYKLSTDAFKESYHGDFVHDMKDRLKTTKNNNEIQFQVAVELINSKGRGRRADRSGINTDTLIAFNETVSLMADGLDNTRNLLRVVLEDMALLSGDIMAHRELTTTGNNLENLNNDHIGLGGNPADVTIWTAAAGGAALQPNGGATWIPQTGAPASTVVHKEFIQTLGNDNAKRGLKCIIADTLAMSYLWTINNDINNALPPAWKAGNDAEGTLVIAPMVTRGGPPGDPWYSDIYHNTANYVEGVPWSGAGYNGGNRRYRYFIHSSIYKRIALSGDDIPSGQWDINDRGGGTSVLAWAQHNNPMSHGITNANLQAYNTWSDPQISFKDCIPKVGEHIIVTYCKEMAFYNAFLGLLIEKYNGIRYLGIGALGDVNTIKNIALLIAGPVKDKRPFWLAYHKYPPHVVKATDIDRTNSEHQFLAEAINHTLMRLDLTFLQTTLIGSVTRLSSSLGANVSTTISTQGTYMDVTPLQNLLIDCLGELKSYAAQFYDTLPKGFMKPYYTPADTTSPSILDSKDKDNASIYQLEYDLTTVFQPHIWEKIRYPPLIASANTVMTNTHKALISDLPSVLLPNTAKDYPFPGYSDQVTLQRHIDMSQYMGSYRSEYYTTLSPYNRGASAILGSIMPSHHQAIKLGPLYSYDDLLSERIFTSTGSDKSDIEQFITEKENVIYLSDLSNGTHLNALLPALNYGIKSMIENFYDYGARKIYKGVLDAILGTKLSKNIENLSSSYPDIAQGQQIKPILTGGSPSDGSIYITKIFNDLSRGITGQHPKIAIKWTEYKNAFRTKVTEITNINTMPDFDTQLIPSGMKCGINPEKEAIALAGWGLCQTAAAGPTGIDRPLTGTCGAVALPGSWKNRQATAPSLLGGGFDNCVDMNRRKVKGGGDPAWAKAIGQNLENNFVGITRTRAVKIAMIELLGGTPTYLDPTWTKAITMSDSETVLWGMNMAPASIFNKYQTLFSTAKTEINALFTTYKGGEVLIPKNAGGEFKADTLFSQLRLFNSYAAMLPCPAGPEKTDLGDIINTTTKQTGRNVLGLPTTYPVAITNPKGTILFEGGTGDWIWDYKQSYEPIQTQPVGANNSLDWYSSVGGGSSLNQGGGANTDITQADLWAKTPGAAIGNLSATTALEQNKGGAQFYYSAYPMSEHYTYLEQILPPGGVMPIKGAYDFAYHKDLKDDNWGVDAPVSVCLGGANTLWQQALSLPFRTGVYRRWDAKGAPGAVAQQTSQVQPVPVGAGNLQVYAYAQELVTAGEYQDVSSEITTLSTAMSEFVETMINADSPDDEYNVLKLFKNSDVYLFSSWLTCGLNMENSYMSGGSVGDKYSELIEEFGTIALRGLDGRAANCRLILEKEMEIAAFINYSMTVGSNNVLGNIDVNSSQDAIAAPAGWGIHSPATVGGAGPFDVAPLWAHKQGYIPSGLAALGDAHWAPPWWQNLYTKAINSIQQEATLPNNTAGPLKAALETNHNNPILNIFDYTNCNWGAFTPLLDPRNAFGAGAVDWKGLAAGPDAVVQKSEALDNAVLAAGGIFSGYTRGSYLDQYNKAGGSGDQQPFKRGPAGGPNNISARGDDIRAQHHAILNQSNNFRVPSAYYLTQSMRYLQGQDYGGVDLSDVTAKIHANGGGGEIADVIKFSQGTNEAWTQGGAPVSIFKDAVDQFSNAFSGTTILTSLRSLKYNPLDICLAKSYVSDSGYLFDDFETESPYYATMNASVGGLVGASWGKKGLVNEFDGRAPIPGTQMIADELKRMPCNQWQRFSDAGEPDTGELLWDSQPIKDLRKSKNTRGYPWNGIANNDAKWGSPKCVTTLCDDGSLPFKSANGVNSSKLWIGAGKINKYLKGFWVKFWKEDKYTNLIKNLMLSAGTDPDDLVNSIGSDFFTDANANFSNDYTPETRRAYAQLRILFNMMFLYTVRIFAQFDQRFGSAMITGGANIRGGADIRTMRRFFAELIGNPNEIALNPNNLWQLILDVFAADDSFSGAPDGAYIQYPIPKADSLLCTSLAIILRKIYTATPSSRAITASPVFLYETLADVKNDALLDVYKLKLPMYREYFLKLANKCRVLRAFMTKGCGSRENKRRLMSVVCPWIRKFTSVNNIPAVYNIKEKFLNDGEMEPADLIDCHMVFRFGKDKFTATEYIDDVSPLLPIYETTEAILGDNVFYSTEINTDEARYSYLIELISNIEDSCTYIAGSCDSILEDFVVNDKYMSLGSEFEQEHKRKHECPHYTPLSLVSAFSTPSEKYLPLHDLNSRRASDAFKLQYGAKEILFSDTLKFLNEKYIHGAVDVIKGVNSLSSVRLDISNYYNFIKRYLHLFRFNYSVLNYGEQNVTSGNYKSTEYRGGGRLRIEGGATFGDSRRDTLSQVQAILGQAVGYNRQYIPQGHLVAMKTGAAAQFEPHQLVLSSAQSRLSSPGLLSKNKYSDKFTIQKVNQTNNNPQGIWLIDYCNETLGAAPGKSPFRQSLAINNDSLTLLIAYVYGLPQPDVIGTQRAILPCINLYIYDILRILDVWKYLQTPQVKQSFKDRSVLTDLIRHVNNMLKNVFTDTTTSKLIWSRRLSNPRDNGDYTTRASAITESYMALLSNFKNSEAIESRANITTVLGYPADASTNKQTNYHRQSEGYAQLNTAIENLNRGDIKEVLMYFNKYILGTLLIKKDFVSTSMNERSQMCTGWTVLNPLYMEARQLWDPMIFQGTTGEGDGMPPINGILAWAYEDLVGGGPTVDGGYGVGPFTDNAYEKLMNQTVNNTPKCLQHWNFGTQALQWMNPGGAWAAVGALGNEPYDAGVNADHMWGVRGRLDGTGAQSVATWREAMIANMVPFRGDIPFVAPDINTGYNNWGSFPGNFGVKKGVGYAASSTWLWASSQYGPFVKTAGLDQQVILGQYAVGHPGQKGFPGWTLVPDQNNELEDIETRLAVSLYDSGRLGWGFPTGVVTNGLNDISYVTTPLQSSVQRMWSDSELVNALELAKVPGVPDPGNVWDAKGVYNDAASMWALMKTYDGLDPRSLILAPRPASIITSTGDDNDIQRNRGGLTPFSSLYAGYLPIRASRLVAINKMANIIARTIEEPGRQTSLSTQGNEGLTNIANRMSHQTSMLNNLKNISAICQAWQSQFTEVYGHLYPIGRTREQRKANWSPFDYNTTMNSGISDWQTGIDDRIYVWMTQFSGILQAPTTERLSIPQEHRAIATYGYNMSPPSPTLELGASPFGTNRGFTSLIGRFINIGAIENSDVTTWLGRYGGEMTRGQLLYLIILQIYELIGKSIGGVSSREMTTTPGVQVELARLSNELQTLRPESRNTLSRYNISFLSKPLTDQLITDNDIKRAFGQHLSKGTYNIKIRNNDVAGFIDTILPPPLQTNWPVVTGGALTGNSVYNMMKDMLPSGLIYTAQNPLLSLTSLIQIITGDDLLDIKDLMITNLRSIIESTNRKVAGDTCGILDNNTQEMKDLVGLLIELNVNPINVHSMQRFIPFSNIYNYSYTLDRFTYTLYNIQRPWDQLVYAGYDNRGRCRSPGQQILGFKNIFTTLNDPSLETPNLYLRNTGAPENLSEVSIDNTEYADMVKEVFIRMLMDPYAKVDQYVYGLPAGFDIDAYAYFWGPISRIMKGFDQLGMGVPKFISDQLYSKVLLNSMSTIHLGPSPATDAIAAQYYSLPMGDTAPYQANARTAISAAQNANRAALMGGNPLYNDNISGGRGDHNPSTWYNMTTPRYENPAQIPSQFVEKVKIGAQGSLVPDSYIRQPIAGSVNLSGNIARMLGFYNTEEKAHMRYDLHAVFSGTGAGGSGDRGPMALGAAGESAGQGITIAGTPQWQDQSHVNDKVAGAGFVPLDCRNYRPPVQATATDTTTIPGLINQFRMEGYERFNTQIVRNAFFITNLQRLMRYAINLWLTKAYGAVSRDHRAISGEVTERRFGDSLQTEADIDYTMPNWI